MDAVRQPAPGGFEARPGAELGIGDVGGEHLADPGEVVAVAEVGGDLGGGAVEGDQVVPRAGVEHDGGDAGGVGEPLGSGVRAGHRCRQGRDEAGGGRGAEQQHLSKAGAVHDDGVLPGGVVDHVDAGRAAAPQVDLGGVGTGLAVDPQPGREQVRGARGIGGLVDDEPVGAGPAVDEGGDGGGRDEHPVGAAAEAEGEALGAGVGEHPGHPEAGHAGRPDGAGQVVGRPGGVEHDGVGARAALEADLAGDSDEFAARRGEPDGVRARAQVDGGAAGVGAGDGEVVAAAAEGQHERLDAGVGDAAGHAQPGDHGGRQRAGPPDQVAGVGDDQGVQAGLVAGDAAVQDERGGDTVQRPVTDGPVGGGGAEPGLAADHDPVVAGAGEQGERHVDRTDGDAVRPRTGVDRDGVDAVADLGPAAVAGAGLQVAGGDDDVLPQAGALHHEPVAAVGGEDRDRDGAGLPEREPHQVGARTGVDRDGSRPRLRGAAAAAEREHPVGVAEQDHGRRGAAGEPGGLEQPAELLGDRTRGEVGADHGAHHEQVVVEAQIGVEGLHQGVVAAGVGEAVLPGAAGDGVVAGARVDAVGVRRADDGVVAGAADQGERGPVLGQAGGVDGVVAGAGVHGDPVALGADGVGGPDRVVADPGDGELDGVGGVGVPVVEGALPDPEGVAGLRAADGEPVAAAGAEQDRERGDAGAVQVGDGDGVGAGACVDRDPLDADRTAGGAAGVGDRPAAGADHDGVGTAGEAEQQPVGARAAVDDGRPAAVEHRGEVVVARAAVQPHGVAVADEVVVAVAAIEGDRPGTGAAEGVVARIAVQGDGSGAVGGEDVVAVAAVEGRRPGTTAAEDVVAVATVERHRHEHRVVDDDGVVTAAEVADDRGDPVVGVAATEGGDADGGALGRAAQLLDDVGLVDVAGADVAAARPQAGVEVQRAAAERGRRSLRTGQVGGPGELEVAQGEAGGLAEGPEQEADPHLDAQLDLHPAVRAGGLRVEAEAGGDPGAGDREPEGTHRDVGGDGEVEPVVGDAVLEVGARLDVEPEVAPDAEAAAADLQVAREVDVEVAVGPQLHRTAHARQPEELHGGVGPQVPVPVADRDREGRVEADDLQQVHSAGQAERERLRRDAEQRAAGGVEGQRAGAREPEQARAGAGADRDGQPERESVALHGCAAVRLEDEPGEVEVQRELELETGRGDGDRDRAARRRQPGEVDPGTDRQPEAGRDRHRTEGTGGAGGVQFDRGRGGRADAEVDPASEAGVEAHLETSHQSGRTDAQAGVAKGDRPDPAELHRAVDEELQARVGDLQFHLAVDHEGVEQPQVPAHQQPPPPGDPDLLRPDDQSAGGIPLEPVEQLHAAHGGGVHCEGLDGLGLVEGVQLQQELAVEAHPRDGVGSDGELDPTDHTGPGGPGAGGQVDHAGDRAQERDGAADGSVDDEVRVVGGAAGGDPEVAGQRDQLRDPELGLHRRLDVELPARGRGGALLAVQARGGGVDGDGGRVARLQQRQQRDRDGQGLGAAGGVEHDRHRAGDLEQVLDRGQPDRHPGGDGEAAGHPEVAADQVGADEQDAGRRPVVDGGGTVAVAEFAGQVQVEPGVRRGRDRNVDPAGQVEQLGAGAGDRDDDLARQFEPEAVRGEHVGAGERAAALAHPLQGEHLGAGLSGEVDLQRAGGVQVEAVLLELGDLRLHRRHAPELRDAGARVSEVEDEPAGGGAEGTQPVHRQAAREGEDEDEPVRVDLQRHLRVQVEQRGVQQAGGLQQDAAREFDEERLALGDDPEAAAGATARVAGGVRPAVRERDRDGAGGEAAAVEVPDGVAVERDGARGTQRFGAGAGELQGEPAQGREVEPADAGVGDVEPDRLGGGAAGGAGRDPGVAVGARPAAGGHRQRVAGEGVGVAEEVAEGAALDQDGGADEGDAGTGAGEGELGGRVEDAGRVDGEAVDRGEGDVDEATVVDRHHVDDLPGVGAGDGCGGLGDREGLGLLGVAAAAGVGEAARHEGDGVGASAQRAAEGVAPGGAGADPGRGAEADLVAGGIAEDDLAATDGGRVDREAGGGPEGDLEVRAGVDDVEADRAAGIGGVRGGADDGEAVDQRRLRWGRPDVVRERVELHGDDHATDAERAGEQVAVGGAGNQDRALARQQRDARGTRSGQHQFVAVDGRGIQAAAHARVEGHVDVPGRGAGERDRHRRGLVARVGDRVEGGGDLAPGSGDLHRRVVHPGAADDNRDGHPVAAADDAAAGVEGEGDPTGGIQLEARGGGVEVEVGGRVEQRGEVDAGAQHEVQHGLAGQAAQRRAPHHDVGLRDERPRAGGRDDGDGAGVGERAGDPVADGVAAAVAAQLQRGAGGVQHRGAQRGPGENELRGGVQQRGEVDRLSVGGGEGDVEPGPPAAAVDDVDVDGGARGRVGDDRGRAGDGEAERGGGAAGPGGGDPAGGGVRVADRAGGEGQHDLADAEGVRERVAEPGDAERRRRRGEQVLAGRQVGAGEHVDAHLCGGGVAVVVVAVERGSGGRQQRHEEDPASGGHRDDRDGPAVHPERGAVQCDRELGPVVEDVGQVEPGAGGGGEDDIDPGAGRAHVHRAAGGARPAEVDAGLGGRRGRVGAVEDVEADLVARGVPEAHLQLAVEGEQAHLVGDVGQEQDGGVALGDLGEVDVEPAREREVVGGEVQLADDQDLAVGGDLEDHLAVEELLGGVDREDLRRAGDHHRRGERGQEAAHGRVGGDRLGLRRGLGLQRAEPGGRRLGGGQPGDGRAERERVVERGQALEELHARGEVVDAEARVGLEQDAAGHLDADEHLQRAELAQAEPDGEAGQPGDRETALKADVEHPVLDRGRGVESADDVEGRVEPQDAADQPGVDLAAEEFALHGDPEGLDRDDRELALGEQ